MKPHDSQLKQRDTLQQIFVAFFFMVVGFTIYSNSMEVPFIFDDPDNIKNPDLQLESITTDNLREVLLGGTLRSRPISNASFALNYYLGGYRVQGYHFVNIIIHICTSLVLYHLFKLTLQFPVNRKRFKYHSSIAFCASFLWLTHPIATQSVTYLVQRMNSLAALFYVVSLLFYVVARQAQIYREDNLSKYKLCLLYLGFAISGMFAIGSKEIAGTLPIIVLLYEWFFVQNLSRKWLVKNIPWIIGVGFLMFVIIYFYTDGHIIRRIFLSGSKRDFTTWERVLTQFRVVTHYIGLIFYPNPNRLVFDYNIPFSTSFFSPISTLFSSLFLLSIFLFALTISRKERLLSFCILWFFINLLIESSIIGLELIFEHRTYMPSMFTLLAAPALLSRLMQPKCLMISICIGVSIIWGYWTFQRNMIWQDQISFWQDSVKKYPGKARSNNNLGVAYSLENNFEKAEMYFNRAITIKSNFPEPYHNIGMIKFKQNSLLEAENYLKRAILYKSHYLEARVHLALLYKQQGMYDKSYDHLSYVLERYPESSFVNIQIGEILLRMGNVNESLKHLDTVYLKKGNDKNLLLIRGEALLKNGKIDDAITMYEKVIQLDSQNSIARYNLGMLLSIKGNDKKALIHYNVVANKQSSNTPVAYNLGNVYLRLGMYDNAEKEYLDLLGLSNVIADAYNNLGLVELRNNNFEKAIGYFRSAIRILPSHTLANNNLILTEKEYSLKNENN